jgi:hypothetical protein
MKTFTVLFEFLGGTYVHQVNAPNVKKAIELWATEFDWGSIDGADQKDVEVLCSDLAMDSPSEIIGLRSVWCTSAELRTHLALVHLVATDCDA